jgi:hypothetical protein
MSTTKFYIELPESTLTQAVKRAEELGLSISEYLVGAVEAEICKSQTRPILISSVSINPRAVVAEIQDLIPTVVGKYEVHTVSELYARVRDYLLSYNIKTVLAEEWSDLSRHQQVAISHHFKKAISDGFNRTLEIVGGNDAPSSKLEIGYRIKENAAI